MDLVNSNSDIPLYLQIADCIRADIRSGVIQPGDQLASEHEMMKRYHVSRMTVRNAFSTLVNEGLIEKHHGKGSFCKITPPKKNIDVLLDMADHYFVSYYLQSISAVLEKNNANLLAGDTRHSNTEILRRLEAIACRGSDGIIVQGCPTADWEEAAFRCILRTLTEKQIPLMVIDYAYPMDGIPTVSMNEYQIGRLAAQHLMDHGHQMTAAICIEHDALSQKRLEGFQALLPHVWKIPQGNRMYCQLREAIAAGITAIFCYNDTIAQKCIDFLKEESLSVPDNLSVVSVDDTILANVYGITSIAHAKNRIGEYAAVQILSGAPESRIFDPVLVERASVKTLGISR